MRLGRWLTGEALRIGFDGAGLCPPPPSPSAVAAYRSWLDAGMHGEMAYMARADRVARAVDPTLSLPGAQCLLVVTRRYQSANVPETILADPARGRIADYAHDSDYHDSMSAGLEELAARARQRLGGHVGAGVFVDARPLLERDAAARSGLGFLGRNTMLIDPRRGSRLLLGALLLDEALAAPPPADGAAAGGTCGGCTRCMDACPTRAFVAPGVLDARRCISYLTIELKGAIPGQLRRRFGNWVFGCDVCNDVCPYNRRADRATPPEDRSAVDPDTAAPRLAELVRLDSAGFADRYGASPVRRARRRGLLRNACVALGNWGSDDAVELLGVALRDEEPLVRGHAAWGLGRCGGRSARRLLATALDGELDGAVRREIASALVEAGSPTGA